MQEPIIRKVILDALNNPKPHFHPMFRFRRCIRSFSGRELPSSRAALRAPDAGLRNRHR